MSPAYVGLMAVVLAGTYIVWYFIYNDLLLLSVNPSLSASRGIKNALTENIFVVILAVAVMLSIKQIGILTINSLLILPAAAARNVSSNSRQYLVLSTVISLFCGIAGLVISFYAGTAAGATMVLIAAAVYFVTYFVSGK